MKTILKIKCIKILQIQHKETGATARLEREKSNISLRNLAKEMGISAPYLSDLERGNRNWSVKIARRYEKALKGRRLNEAPKSP